jgi:hypothetical protein
MPEPDIIPMITRRTFVRGEPAGLFGWPRPPARGGLHRYGKWRQYDAEDTVRFYALRLREAGVIKSSPQKIIAQGTDWRFFNELKKEFKG